MPLCCSFCPICPVQYCLEDERCIQYFDNICVILQTVLTVGAAVCMIYCLLVSLTRLKSCVLQFMYGDIY